MHLAIIPARGGSKRIPRKNIRHFCGKPIIVYSIQAAIDSGYFDEVMVSTEDEEIAKIAKEYGAQVPFMRSAQTATDFATTADVLVEVINTYHKYKVYPKIACCIYPTAPFVTAKNLQIGFEKLKENETIAAVIPITRFSYPIQRAFLMENDKIKLFYPEHISTRSQDLEPAYHDVGQFYWFRVEPFLQSKNLINAHTAGVLLPEWQVQDIDNLEDWTIAEMKYQLIKNKQE